MSGRLSLTLIGLLILTGCAGIRESARPAAPPRLESIPLPPPCPVNPPPECKVLEHALSLQELLSGRDRCVIQLTTYRDWWMDCPGSASTGGD